MPALKALIAQLVGLITVAVSIAFGLLPADAPLALAISQGGIAAATSLAQRSDRWWPLIHLLFAPSALLVARLNLDPAWFLAGFILLVLIFGSSFRTQVPLFLSNRLTADTLNELLPDASQARVIDLGSGTGSAVCALAKRHPAAKFVGIESSLLPLLISQVAARGLANCSLRRGDFWREKLTDYDVVYAFLSPVPMPRLWRKARAEMKRGSLLISNSFPIPGATPERIVAVGDHRGTQLFLYRV